MNFFYPKITGGLASSFQNSRHTKLIFSLLKKTATSTLSILLSIILLILWIWVKAKLKSVELLIVFGKSLLNFPSCLETVSVRTFWPIDKLNQKQIKIKNVLIKDDVDHKHKCFLCDSKNVEIIEKIIQRQPVWLIQPYLTTIEMPSFAIVISL